MACMTRCSQFKACASRMGSDCKKLGGTEIPKINGGGRYHGTAKHQSLQAEEWKMTPEQLAEYVKKHPIVYREDLKPSPTFTMAGWKPDHY
ncbi:hypothetical protein MOF19_16415 [Bacillus spizizenii]|nr:hypothetical protein [Bacillus spizizenii]